MTIVDLTWRVDLQTADKAKENLEKAKGGHLGTHFDVMSGRSSECHPSSLEDGRVASDEDEVNKEFPLEYMERDAVVFDVAECGTERDITLDDIDINEVPEGGFVAFRTGYIEQIGYGTKEYFQHHPALSMQLIDALLDRHVAIIAVDFAGVRNGKEHTPTDQICADRGTFIVENVCNLAVVLNGNKSAHFTAGTYPVNFVGMTGLPCRVVARV